MKPNPKLDQCEDPEIHERAVATAREKLLTDREAQGMSELFKALSSPTRLRIISALAEVELCVDDLVSLLGMSQSAVSHQLRLLRNTRLVKYRKMGKHVYYQLDDEHVQYIFDCGLDHIKEDRR